MGLYEQRKTEYQGAIYKTQQQEIGRQKTEAQSNKPEELQVRSCHIKQSLSFNLAANTLPNYAKLKTEQVKRIH